MNENFPPQRAAAQGRKARARFAAADGTRAMFVTAEIFGRGAVLLI
ncbi:MAG: hypothetical protein JO295_10135 [Verrucomicrobia bacterium]|nr:hypothetical protein [Verrucomicrobiota bacterium]